LRKPPVRLGVKEAAQILIPATFLVPIGYEFDE